MKCNKKGVFLLHGIVSLTLFMSISLMILFIQMRYQSTTYAIMNRFAKGYDAYVSWEKEHQNGTLISLADTTPDTQERW